MKKIYIVTLLLLFISIPSMLFAASLMEQADGYVVAKQYKAAIKIYKQVIEKNPSQPKAYNNMGYAYAQLKDYRNAIKAYESALSIKSDYKEAQNNLLASISQYSQDCIDNGKYSTAVEQLTAAISRFPKAGELHYFLGVTYQAQGKFKQAFEQWKQAAQLTPNSSIAQYVKGIEKLINKNVSGAIADLKKALDIMPSNAYARNMLGILQVQSGDMEAAKATFKEAIKYKPNYVEAYQNLAYIAEKTGNMDEAIQYYKTATAKNPYSVKGLMAVGKIYFTHGQYFDAESAYKRAIRIHPLSGDLYKSLGFTFAKQNKYPEAIAAFEKAVKMAPDDSEAAYALGLIYSSVKTPEYAQKAAAAFEKAKNGKDSKFANLAAQKLSQTNVAPDTASEQALSSMAEISAESPEGDISLTINSDWTEVPVPADSGDRFLWIMSNLKKGMMLTVYKPQDIGDASLESVKKEMLKQASSGMSGISEKSAPVGNISGYMAEGKTSDNKIRRVYIATNHSKAYIITVEVPKAEFLNEIDALISKTVIK